MFRRVRSWSLTIAWLFAGIAAAAILATPAEASREPLQPAAGTVRIKLIAFNDLHGHLEAPR
jgi:2',3'-cyclic-nucleotide 2'-phosphodiesterase (5'-nucleotidase family)